MPASRLGYKEGQLTFLVGVGIGSTQPHNVVPKRGQQPFAGAECSESLWELGKDLRARPITSKSVRRSTSTHRVVCEPLQDDGSGEGIAGRKGKATVGSGSCPPLTLPTRVRLTFGGGGLGSLGTRPSYKGATPSIQGDDVPAQVFGRGECSQYRKTHVLLNELGVAEVGPAFHSAALLLRHRGWLPGAALLPAGTAGQRPGPPRSALSPPPTRRRSPPSIALRVGAEPSWIRQRPDDEQQVQPHPWCHKPAAARQTRSSDVVATPGVSGQLPEATSFGPPQKGRHFRKVELRLRRAPSNF